MTVQRHLKPQGRFLLVRSSMFSYANGTGSVACAQLLILVLTRGPSLGSRASLVAPFSLLAKAWQGTTREWQLLRPCGSSTSGASSGGLAINLPGCHGAMDIGQRLCQRNQTLYSVLLPLRNPPNKAVPATDRSAPLVLDAKVPAA